MSGSGMDEVQGYVASGQLMGRKCDLFWSGAQGTVLMFQ